MWQHYDFSPPRDIGNKIFLEVDANNVGDAIAEACVQFGDDFAALVPSCRIWVNGNPAELTDSVTAQDEIALLPPVSGGSLNHDSLDAPHTGLHIAILSLHTSPLAQPGTGDSGGMNVYIREVASALAHRGATCTVYVRKWDPELVHELELELEFILSTLRQENMNYRKKIFIALLIFSQTES